MSYNNIFSKIINHKKIKYTYKYIKQKKKILSSRGGDTFFLLDDVDRLLLKQNYKSIFCV